MNVLHQLRSERLKSELPIVKVVEKGSEFKIVGIAMSKGVILKDHKSSLKSRLVVIEGTVDYKEVSRTITLHQFDELEIPINEIHALVAKDDALCLLIQKN